jgi:RecB family exonuclease
MPREKNPEASPARKRAPRKRAAAAEVARPSFVDPQQRAALTARAAYFRAMNRGFAPGHEVEDWLAAEAEVDAELLQGTATSAHT